MQKGKKQENKIKLRDKFFLQMLKKKSGPIRKSKSGRREKDRVRKLIREES